MFPVQIHSAGRYSGWIPAGRPAGRPRMPTCVPATSPHWMRSAVGCSGLPLPDCVLDYTATFATLVGLHYRCYRLHLPAATHPFAVLYHRCSCHATCSCHHRLPLPHLPPPPPPAYTTLPVATLPISVGFSSGLPLRSRFCGSIPLRCHCGSTLLHITCGLVRRFVTLPFAFSRLVILRRGFGSGSAGSGLRCLVRTVPQRYLRSTTGFCTPACLAHLPSLTGAYGLLRFAAERYYFSTCPVLHLYTILPPCLLPLPAARFALPAAPLRSACRLPLRLRTVCGSTSVTRRYLVLCGSRHRVHTQFALRGLHFRLFFTWFYRLTLLYIVNTTVWFVPSTVLRGHVAARFAVLRSCAHTAALARLRAYAFYTARTFAQRTRGLRIRCLPFYARVRTWLHWITAGWFFTALPPFAACLPFWLPGTALPFTCRSTVPLPHWLPRLQHTAYTTACSLPPAWFVPVRLRSSDPLVTTHRSPHPPPAPLYYPYHVATVPRHLLHLRFRCFLCGSLVAAAVKLPPRCHALPRLQFAATPTRFCTLLPGSGYTATRVCTTRVAALRRVCRTNAAWFMVWITPPPR